MRFEIKFLQLFSTSNRESNKTPRYSADTLWSFKELQQYVAHVKSLTPKLTRPAKEVLGRYYRLQREQISRNVSRTTIRMLESLVRFVVVLCLVVMFMCL